MKTLGVIGVVLMVMLLAIEQIARFVIAAFCILFFGWWGYKTYEEIHQRWRARTPRRRTA